jgi:hypothetical protein
MPVVFQVLAIVLTTCALAMYFKGWIARQDQIKLNANPFAYIFGPNGSKFIINLAFTFTAIAIFAKYDCEVLAWGFLMLFGINWLIKTMMFGLIVNKPSAPVVPPVAKAEPVQHKRVHLIA